MVEQKGGLTNLQLEILQLFKYELNEEQLSEIDFPKVELMSSINFLDKLKGIQKNK